MTLADLCVRIYAINLPERHDRKAQLEQEFAHAGFSWSPDHVLLWPATRPADANGFPTLGCHGCFLSHVGALTHALSVESGWIAIFEDDAVFLPELTAQLPKLSQLMASEQADLIYLGHCDNADTEQKDEVFQPSTQALVGAHAYLVRRSLLPELLAYLNACLERPAGHPLGGRLHYDGALSMFRAFHPHVRTWFAQPSLVEQRFSRSDIQPRWWYDRLPLLRQLSAWAREFKQARRHRLHHQASSPSV